MVRFKNKFDQVYDDLILSTTEIPELSYYHDQATEFTNEEPFIWLPNFHGKIPNTEEFKRHLKVICKDNLITIVDEFANETAMDKWYLHAVQVMSTQGVPTEYWPYMLHQLTRGNLNKIIAKYLPQEITFAQAPVAFSNFSSDVTRRLFPTNNSTRPRILLDHMAQIIPLKDMATVKQKFNKLVACWELLILRQPKYKHMFEDSQFIRYVMHRLPSSHTWSVNAYYRAGIREQCVLKQPPPKEIRSKCALRRSIYYARKSIKLATNDSVMVTDLHGEIKRSRPISVPKPSDNRPIMRNLILGRKPISKYAAHAPHESLDEEEDSEEFSSIAIDYKCPECTDTHQEIQAIPNDNGEDTYLVYAVETATRRTQCTNCFQYHAGQCYTQTSPHICPSCKAVIALKSKLVTDKNMIKLITTPSKDPINLLQAAEYRVQELKQQAIKKEATQARKIIARAQPPSPDRTITQDRDPSTGDFSMIPSVPTPLWPNKTKKEPHNTFAITVPENNEASEVDSTSNFSDNETSIFHLLQEQNLVENSLSELEAEAYPHIY